MAISSSAPCPTTGLFVSPTCNFPGPAPQGYCISAANECGTTSSLQTACGGSSIYQRVLCMDAEDEDEDEDDDDDEVVAEEWTGDVILPIEPEILVTPDLLLDRR